MNRLATKMAVAAALAAAAWGASAQNITLQPPQNVLQLSASGTVEVQQDMLTLSLTTTKEGSDATAVQNQLKAALDAALAVARPAAQPGQLDVRTGNFSLYPRYNRDGKIASWQGNAELILEGKDIPRITSTAGKITTLTTGNVNFGLSKEQRAKVEGEAQAIAIQRFQAKAVELARGFGFTGYSLREVNVNSSDQGGGPRPRMMAMEAKASADAAVPVEAGKASVVVMVNGSVQLTK
jgi:predicted secreted protein